MKFILIICLIFQRILGEQPLSSCAGHRPFKMADNSCGKFNEICYKSGDQDCDQYQAACQQCPATNFSLIMFNDMRLLKDNTNENFLILKKQIIFNNESNNQMKNQIKVEIKTLEKKLDAVIIILCIFFCFIILILLLEIRFKLITKSFEDCTKKGQKIKYRELKKEKYLNIESVTDLKNNINSINEELKKLTESEKYFKININSIYEELKKLTVSQSDRKITKIFSNIQFKFVDFDLTVTLEVKKEDNVVKIKQKLSENLPKVDNDNFKIMKLKFNDKFLDNNDYLLKYISNSSNDIINCEIDDKVSPKNILVLKMISNRNLPTLIQITKSETIYDLKLIIIKINENIILANLKIFKDSQLLNDKVTLKNLDCKDFDCINVIEEEKGDLIITSLFEEKNIVTIECCNVDKVSDIKEKITRKLNENILEISSDNFQNNLEKKSEDIYLIFDNKNLDNKSYLFENKITNTSEIVYWIYKTFPNNWEIDKSSIIPRNESHIFKAKLNNINKYLFIKRYDRDKIGINEIHSDFIPYKFLRFNPNFIQLFDIFKDDKYLYCSMEYMEEGSFEDLVKNSDKLPIKETRIAKWCKQILFGMNYLSMNRSDQGNLRPSCFLIDKFDNVKIATFGLSTHLFGFNLGEVPEDFIHKYEGIMRYMAPEIFNNLIDGYKSNIWALGSIIMEVATGKQPYHGMSEKEAAIEIIRQGKIEFDHKNMSANLKIFIDKCLVKNTRERASVEDLRNDPFLIPENVITTENKQ